MNIEIIEPTNEERGEPPEPVKQRPGRPFGSKNKRPIRRMKRVLRPRTVEDVKVAGVAATASDAGKAEPTRQDADEMGSITRQSLEERQMNIFDLPEHRKRAGWDYRWEPVSVMNQPVQRHYMRDAERAGWRAEKARDWPELAEGLKPDDPIEEGGQQLLGRPMHLSMEAQVEIYNKAKQQERDRMQAAAGGHVVGGQEGLANIRGVEVRNPSLQVELAIGSAR